MYKLFVVVQVDNSNGLCMRTEVLEFPEEDEADIAHDKLMNTHCYSNSTRYEVTKLY